MQFFQATPIPQLFNPNDFLASLSSSGPQLTTGIKGDWIGLYKRFLRSPNFSGWFQTRYTELSQQLQAKQLEKLSQAVCIKISIFQSLKYIGLLISYQFNNHPIRI